MGNPVLATSSAGGTQQTPAGGGSKNASAPIVPFIRASNEHREPCGIDKQVTSTASDQDLGVFDIPAYGYVRALWIYVTTPTNLAASGAGLAYHEDAPFNLLKNIFLQEPNGAVLHQYMSGYDLFLADKYGGYRGENDPRGSAIFSLSSSASAYGTTFALRIPIEIDMRDGLGSLPNQNAAAMFKLRMALQGESTWVTAGTVTTHPVFRVRVSMECWDQPDTNGPLGPQQTMPPAVNTTQYWTATQYQVNAGQNSIRLTRVGNYIRMLGFVFRTTTGRVTASTGGEYNMPDPIYLYWDTRPLDVFYLDQWRATMCERYGYGSNGKALEAAGGLDKGVYFYDFAHEFSGKVGMENRDLWLPTLQSTRLELQGSFGSAGTLTVLTNDVSVAGAVFL